MIDLRQIKEEIEEHAGHFRNKGAFKKAKRWESVMRRITGSDYGAISDEELEGWNHMAHRWKWKRGMLTLPKVIEYLKKEDSLERDHHTIEELKKQNAGPSIAPSRQGLAEPLGQAEIDRIVAEAMKRHNERVITPEMRAEAAERARKDREEAEKKGICGSCWIKKSDIKPGSCTLRDDCYGAKPYEIDFVNARFVRQHLAFETLIMGPNGQTYDIPWMTVYDPNRGQDGYFKVALWDGNDWTGQREVDLSQIPGGRVTGMETVPIPPHVMTVQCEMQYKNSKVVKMEMTRANPRDVAIDFNLESLWGRRNLEAFGNALVSCPNVNGADNSEGDTLAHKIARWEHPNAYAWLETLVRMGGVDLHWQNNAGRTVIAEWSANETVQNYSRNTEAGNIPGHTVVLENLHKWRDQMDKWPEGGRNELL